MLFVAAQVVVTREGRRIVDGASIEARAGAIVSIQGASGSGKSTFLRALAWLIPIDGGRITLDGKSPREHGVLSYRRRVAYVAQLPRMFEGTVADNLAAGPRYRGALSSDRTGIDRTLLDQVGLPHDMALRSAADLSGGERLRVALARALANQPRLLLLDEPTSALDPQAAQVVVSTLATLAAGGTAIVVVTHMEAHAQQLGGERYRMSSGVLRQEPAL